MVSPALPSAPVTANASGLPRGQALNGVAWSLTILSLLFVTARIYSRTKLSDYAGLDDLFIGVAAFFAVAYSALLSAAVYTGTGQHMNLIPPPEIPRAIIISDIATATGIFAITIPKLAVAFLLVRVFNTRPIVTWFLVGCAILINLGGVTICFVIFLHCSPPASQWDPTIQGKCLPPLNTLGASIFGQAFSAALDLTYAIFPAIMISKLHMTRERKWGLTILMGLGVFAAFTAIYKGTRLRSFTDRSDFTYSNVELNIWAVVEANVLIIAACVPTVGPFARKITGKVRGPPKSRLIAREGGHNIKTDGAGSPAYASDEIHLVPYPKESCNASPNGKMSKSTVRGLGRG